jgi:tetratricopeptide (TPR) repeat protein
VLRADIRPQEVLYIPSAKTVKRMSLGYTGLMADIYWTRAVQYFGNKHRFQASDYRLLYPLLDITADLDPHLVVAYEFGGIFLAQQPPNGAGQPDKAVEFVERGIKNNPTEWRLYYNLGFVQAMELKDYTAAARTFDRGSKVPGAHPWLRVLAAALAQHGGDLQTARLLWRVTYENTEDKMIKSNAIRHLMALDVDETVPQLEAAVQSYRTKTGSLPSSFSQLIAAGYLPRLPLDPIGDPYRLLPDGRVEVQDPDALPFITQGLPPGYKPKMANPMDFFRK